MTTEISMYNNPAGRLYLILKKFVENHGQAVQLEQFASRLGVSPEWSSVSKAVTGLLEEYYLLEEKVEEIKETNQHKYNFWKTNLKLIKTSVTNYTINTQNNVCILSVVPQAITALEFMAADIPMDSDEVKDEIDNLRKSCDDLRVEILGTTDLPKALRDWLLDLVRIMRDAIDRYTIRGMRGLRPQLNEMLGSLITHPNLAEKIKQENPTIWSRVINVFNFLSKAQGAAEKTVKSIELGHKVYNLIYGDGTNSPPMIGG